ncbi:MAG TPA: hypothetical protein VNW72_04195 [Chthoniobacterales bacterium]|jgi:hypothetical protein|nr:hypothetical protein [Chthoniobacterales bacterium]
MKRSVILYLVVAVLLFITAHHVPAPIQEIPESPTPTPKLKAVAKSKTETESEKTHAVKEGASPSHLAGTWTGFVNAVESKDGMKAPYDFAITVSSDAKTVLTKPKLSTESNWRKPYQSACQGGGNLIRWKFLIQNREAPGLHSFILQLHDNRTATLTWHCQVTSGPHTGVTIDGTGVMTKQ